MDYKDINTASLPQDVAEVFNIIKTDTENFTNELAIKAHSENLDKLMKLINNKFPEATKVDKVKIKNQKSKTISQTSNLQAEIEGLKILMDIAETKAEKDNLQAEIEGLQILIDIQ